MPGHVGICTKCVVAGLNDGQGGSLSITVVVEYRCSRAVSLGMPAPHKPTTLWAQEDWVQKGNQLLGVIFAIETSKNNGWTEAAWVSENSKVRLKYFESKEKAGALLNKLANYGKKVKWEYGPIGPSGQSLSRFLWHEATSSISTPPWMECWSIAGLPPALSSPVPIYTPGWSEALWE